MKNNDNFIKLTLVFSSSENKYRPMLFYMDQEKLINRWKNNTFIIK